MDRWGKVFIDVRCNFGGSGERVAICLDREGVVGLIGVCDGSWVVAWYCLGHTVSGILYDWRSLVECLTSSPWKMLYILCCY
jgi:hypothetical protein